MTPINGISNILLTIDLIYFRCVSDIKEIVCFISAFFIQKYIHYNTMCEIFEIMLLITIMT